MKRLNKLVLAAAALTAALALAGCDNGSPSSSGGGGGSSYDPWEARLSTMKQEVSDLEGIDQTEPTSSPMSIAKKAKKIAENADAWIGKGAGAQKDAEFELLAQDAAQLAYNQATAADVFQYEDGDIKNTALSGLTEADKTEIKNLLAFANKALNPPTTEEAEEEEQQSSMIPLRSAILTDDELAGKSLAGRALAAIEAIIAALNKVKEEYNTSDLKDKQGIEVAPIGDNNPFTPISEGDLKKSYQIAKAYSYKFDNTKLFINLEAEGVKAHVNGAGDVGYWVGLQFEKSKFSTFQKFGVGYGKEADASKATFSFAEEKGDHIFRYFNLAKVLESPTERSEEGDPCVYFVATTERGTTRQVIVGLQKVKNPEPQTITVSDSGIGKATLEDKTDLPNAKTTNLGTFNDPTLHYFDTDPTTYTIKLTATGLVSHINDQGKAGHWVGVNIPVGEGDGKWITKDDTLIWGSQRLTEADLEKEFVGSNGSQYLPLYWDAAKGKAEFQIETNRFKYQTNAPIKKTFKFVVEMPEVKNELNKIEKGSIPFEPAPLGDKNDLSPLDKDKLYDGSSYELDNMTYYNPAEYKVSLKATKLKAHVNGKGDVGYWVGVKIPVGEGKWLKATDDIAINGKQSRTVQNILDEDKTTDLSIYWDCSKQKNLSFTVTRKDANAKPPKYTVEVQFEGTTLATAEEDDKKIEIGKEENDIKNKTKIEAATIADKNPVTQIPTPVTTNKLSDMYYYDSDPTTYYVKLTATDLKAHVNGEGNVGYWVGVALDKAEGVWKLEAGDKLVYGFENGKTTTKTVDGNKNIYWNITDWNNNKSTATAFFEVTRNNKKRYRLNVELDVAKTADQKDENLATTEKDNFKTATLGDWGTPKIPTTDLYKDDSYKLSKISYKYDNPKKYEVTLEIENLRRHINAEKTPGYWVGVDLTGKWAADGDTLVSVNGVPPKTNPIDAKGLQLYWDAGKSLEQTIKIRKASKNAFGISNYEYEVVVKVDLKKDNQQLTQHPAIIDFGTAPIVDQGNYITKEDLYDNQSYNVTDAGYIGNNPQKYLVKLAVKNLKTHQNGEKQRGYWLGIKLPKEWISKDDKYNKADGENLNLTPDPNKKVTELDTVEGKECFTVYWDLEKARNAGNKGTFVFEHQGKTYTIIVDFSGCTKI